MCFRTLVKSLYDNAKRRPLRLILLTDAASLRTAANLLTHERIPFYHDGRLVTPPRTQSAMMRRIPVYVDFVDIDSLREYVEIPAWAMKARDIWSCNRQISRLLHSYLTEQFGKNKLLVSYQNHRF